MREHELRATLRAALPHLRGSLESLQRYTCEHDEWCSCDREAQLSTIIQVAEELLDGKEPARAWFLETTTPEQGGESK